MRSLSVKLILAFLVISLVGTSLVAVYVAFMTTNRFGEFVMDQYLEQLTTRWLEYYRANGSWQGVAEGVPMSSPFVGKHGPPRMEGPQSPSPADVPPASNAARPGTFVLADQNGQVLIAGSGYRVDDQVSRADMDTGAPILMDGVRVGTLVTARRPTWEIPPDNLFLTGFYRALAIGGAGATLIALVLGVLLARSITRPLRELTVATISMSQGNLAQEIPIRSRDELGELARSFNLMSSQLSEAEDSRRQMTADIAHELRTPLSLILGHTEALSDGVLPPSRETIEIIYDEARRLTQLVEDLRTLSLFDAGEPNLLRQPTAPRGLLEGVARAYRPQALARQIDLAVQAAPDLPLVEVDADRMAQVFGNLISNALRYTPATGRITLSAQAHEGEVRLAVQDSGPGIGPEDLAHIFERFYRSDKSRQREEGGSGLGLAIARSIVEGHGGRLWAESTLGEGTTFHISLPAA